MKRVLFAITGTIAGLAALLGYKTHGASSGPVALPSAGVAPPSTSGATSGASPAPSGHTSAQAPSTTHAPVQTGGGPGSSHPAPANTTPAGAAPRTVIGQAEQTPYGVVQVKVTATGKHITNVGFVQLTADDGHSQSINQQAAPILLQQTLQAQSANINGVSGASFTSQGYVASLQSALDQL